MNLAGFPVEVLSHIFGLDNTSHEVLELWKSGNRLLISKLATGVRRIVLTNTRRDDVSRWPQCLSQLQQLEELWISSSSTSLGSADDIHRELKRLSPNLRVLILGIPHAEVIMFGPQKTISPTPDEDAPRPSKRSKQVETADADATHAEMWNLDLTWPRLECFSCTGSADALPSRVFALLPRSLLTLDLTGFFSSIDATHFDTLPPNLEQLWLDPIVDPSGLDRLPRTITCVGESLDANAHLALVKNPSLLPNLKDLSMEGYASSIEWITTSEDGKWPTCIEKAHLHDIRAESIFQSARPLPRRLKTLVIESSDSDYDLTAEWLINAFPPFLGTLYLERIAWDGIKTSLWPPTLQSLTLTYDLEFGSLNYHQLPRSLTYFRSVTHVALRGEKDRPLKKDALYALGRELVLTLDKDLLHQLKQELVKHTLNLTGSNDKAVALIDAIENGRHFGLPLGLLELKLGMDTCFDDYCLALPPRLRRLQLPGVLTSQPGFLELLPPTITHLTTSFPQYCSAASVSDPTSTALYQLPLQHLVFNIHDPTAGDPYALACLPRCLKTLRFQDFTGFVTIANDILKNLPPGLTSLELETKCASTGWLTLLPTSLTTFKTNHTLSGSDLFILPRNLKTLRANIKNVKLADLWTLPRSITSLELLMPRPTSKKRSEFGLMIANKTPYVPSSELLFSDLSFFCRQYSNPSRMFKTKRLEQVELELVDNRP